MFEIPGHPPTPSERARCRVSGMVFGLQGRARPERSSSEGRGPARTITGRLPQASRSQSNAFRETPCSVHASEFPRHMAAAQQWQPTRRSTDRQMMDVIQEGDALVPRDVVTNAVKQVDGCTSAGHFGGSRDCRFGKLDPNCRGSNGWPPKSALLQLRIGEGIKNPRRWDIECPRNNESEMDRSRLSHVYV